MIVTTFEKSCWAGYNKKKSLFWVLSLTKALHAVPDSQTVLHANFIYPKGEMIDMIKKAGSVALMRFP